MISDDPVNVMINFYDVIFLKIITMMFLFI